MHQVMATTPVPGDIDVWSYDLLEVGGRIELTKIRTFLYYLASPRTQALFCSALNSSERSATLRAYGPVAEDGDCVYVEMTVSGSDKLALKDNNLLRLPPEEILLFRDKVKEKVVESHPAYPHKCTATPGRILKALGLPTK